MIAIFLNKPDAQKMTNDIHNYLLNNCPKYNAIKWQDPIPNKDSTLFFIEIPQEYYNDYYSVVIKIKTLIDPDIALASQTIIKPPDNWDN